MMTDHLGGDPRLVIPAAAAVEFYHLASLILDDVQDHSEIRRGEPTVHVRVGPSTAVNLALFVRSLAYHVINRDPAEDQAMRLAVHQELDRAATWLILGQGIDIGWHEKWYASYREFPYEKMVNGKSGALFGCAAAVGACASKVSQEMINAAREWGIAFGAVYQLIDDYLDVFGDEPARHRPKFDDFREGKMTAPVIRLLAALERQSRNKDADLVVAGLAGRGQAQGWTWLLDLMDEHDIGGRLRQEISQRAARLADPAIRPGCGGPPPFDQLLDFIVMPTRRG
jgi:geranylgeranyl pyrophosphate synthase